MLTIQTILLQLPFWGYIKCQKMDAGGVAPLKKNGKLYSSSTDKAEILSEQFTSVFTRDQMDAIAHLPGHDYPSIESQKRESLSFYPNCHHSRPQDQTTYQIDC